MNIKAEINPTRKLLPLVITLVIGAAAGYGVGLNSASIRDTPVVTDSGNEHQANHGPNNNVTTSHQADSQAGASHTSIQNLANTSSETDVDWEDDPDFQKSDAISDDIGALSQLSSAQNPANFSAIGEIQQRLTDSAKQDNKVLAQLISAFEENLDNHAIKQNLFLILAQINDPEVEVLAKDLVRSDDRATRISGLDLLGELKIPSKETWALTKGILADNPDDPEILLSAMHAVPNMPLSDQENGELIGVLSNLTQSDNEAVRSASILSISQWAKDAKQLAPVIQALNSEVTDDKISAAMALEQSSVVDPTLRETLLEKMTDDKELWEVRTMSANALGRFNLNKTNFLMLENFRKQQSDNVKH